MTAPAEWQPANQVEEALMAAGLANDRQMFFQVVASADLYLPQMSGLSGPQRFLTIHSLGQVFLPVFTSTRGLAQLYGQAVDGYTVTNFAELSRKWPDPDWRLAINPGTPLDAYLSIESLMQAALGDLQVPTMHELVETAEKDEILDVELRDRHAKAGPYPEGDALGAALAAGDVYGYIDLLLDRNVLIPVARPADAEAILGDDFPWQPGADRIIEVFTGEDTLARRHPVAPPETVEVALAFALAAWPDEHGISVDPDSAGAFELPADQVLALLAFRAG